MICGIHFKNLHKKLNNNKIKGSKMKLKYIRFCFENCDVITIDGKYIGAFCVDKFKSSIHRIACNTINKMECAKQSSY